MYAAILITSTSTMYSIVFISIKSQKEIAGFFWRTQIIFELSTFFIELKIYRIIYLWNYIKIVISKKKIRNNFGHVVLVTMRFPGEWCDTCCPCDWGRPAMRTPSKVKPVGNIKMVLPLLLSFLSLIIIIKMYYKVLFLI